MARLPSKPYECLILYLYSLLNLSSVILLKDFRQNATASSIDNPSTCRVQTSAYNYHRVRLGHITFKNKPYCSRPECFRSRSLLSTPCKLRMHIGKFFRASSSTISAVIASSPPTGVPFHSEGTPTRKPCERLDKMGTRRESSSRRGRALAVS